MTLIIKQLVIRGEVTEDSGRSDLGSSLNYDRVKELIDAAKREIEKECREKISEMIENSAAR